METTIIFSLDESYRESFRNRMAFLEKEYDDLVKSYEDKKDIDIEAALLKYQAIIESEKAEELEHYKKDPRSVLPQLLLDINTIIDNIGDMDLEIISMEAELPFVKSIWRFFSGNKLLDKDKIPIEFPFPISVKKQVNCIITAEVEPRPRHNPAKFATILSSYSLEIIKVQIKLIARDESGLTFDFSKSLDISTKHLKEKYENYWREEGKTELLRLLTPGREK